jgi:hypothetical protein
MNKRNVIITIISVLILSCLLAFARTTTTDLTLVKPTWTENIDILDDINANSDLLEAFANDPLQFDSDLERLEDRAGAMWTGNTETFIALTYQDADNTIDAVVPVKDEDDMASDSAAFLCTQQSTKAYVDALSTTYQPLDTALTNISALVYVSPSFIKLTADDTYVVRTLAETKTDLSLNNVTNDAQMAKSIGTTQGDIIYFTGSATPVRLAKGTATQVLAMNAGATAPEWTAAAGGGDVSKVGTPVNSQVGVWTGDGTIEGAASFTYDGANLQFTGDLGSTGTRITKGWFADLQVTNAIAGGVTGNAATVTTNANLTGIVTSAGNATAIANKAIAIAKLADGTDGELITWDATGVIATIPVGTATHVLTSGGTGVAPTFQAVSATDITVADTADATCWVGLWESVTGSQAPKSDAGITYNAETGMLTVTGVTAPLTGNAATCTTASAGDAAVDFFGAGVDAVTDATTCTDIEGTLLAIAGGTLNAAIPADHITYDMMQDTTGTDKVLGRSTAGAGTVEEIACTAAGRAILDDANAAAQRATLGAAASGANTDITSILNAALYVGRDADNTINFATDNHIIFKTSGATGMEVDSTGELDMNANAVGFTLQSTTGDGTTTIDWKLGNKFKFTFGAQNDTLTFTAPTNPCTLMLTIIQDGTGSRTMTWPATVKWAGGTAPTLTTTANARDKVALDWDGAQYDGVASLDFK